MNPSTFWRLRLIGIACLSLTCSALGQGQTLTNEASGTHKVSGDYKISPEDLIVVNVFLERDLSGEFPVSQSGDITFPLLRAVNVAGKTAAQVEKLIRERLIGEDYMKDPQVTVAVKEYRRRAVSVLGQVNKPGLVPLPPEQPMTILEAITAAGGLTDVAKKGRIEVTRKGSGKPRRFDFDDLQKATDPEKIFYLQPNDLIYVHERLL